MIARNDWSSRCNVDDVTWIYFASSDRTINFNFQARMKYVKKLSSQLAKRNREKRSRTRTRRQSKRNWFQRYSFSNATIHQTFQFLVWCLHRALSMCFVASHTYGEVESVCDRAHSRCLWVAQQSCVCSCIVLFQFSSTNLPVFWHKQPCSTVSLPTFATDAVNFRRWLRSFTVEIDIIFMRMIC